LVSYQGSNTRVPLLSYTCKHIGQLEAARQSALYGSQSLDIASASPTKGGSFIGLNTLSFPRQEVIRIPLKIYNGRSAFTLSKVDEESGFIIAKDKIGNGLIELESLTNLQNNIQLATGISLHKDIKGRLYI
jgi:hypothetical protein